MRIRVGIVLLVLLGAGVAVTRADRAEETPLRMSFALFPMQLGEWQGRQNPPFSARVLEVLGLDDYLTRGYFKGTRSFADLYVGYWRSQRQGDTMHSPQNCLPAAGWVPVKQSLLTMTDPRNRAQQITVNRYLIQKGMDRQLVLYWYQGRGRIIGSEYWSKIYLVVDAARLNRTDAAIVRVVVPVAGPADNDETLAEQDAIDFINAFMPQLGKFLPD
jgi:EpsI family protein